MNKNIYENNLSSINYMLNNVQNLHIARDEIRIIDAREIRGDGG